MIRIDLALGPVSAAGSAIHRSGLRWLVPEGHACRAGEAVAFCYVGIRSPDGRSRAATAFAREQDLIVTISAPIDGVLHQRPEASLGGWLDQMDRYQSWDEAFVPGSLKVAGEPKLEALRWSLTFMAGERVTDLAEDRSGLLTGWRLLRRAWHGEQAGHGTLLSLGICEQNGIFLGEKNDFRELLAASFSPLHAVHVGDETLVPSASVLADRLTRDARANSLLAADMAQAIAGGTAPPGPADLLFAGSALSALTRCPISEKYDLLTRKGLGAPVAPEAVVLSVHSEPKIVLRHKKLGYRAFWHRFRIDSTGHPVRNWLNVSFEPERRTIADIQRDLVLLCRLLAERGTRHVLIMNALSSSGDESIFSYAPFNADLGEELGSVRAKELNLMLHDLTAQVGAEIVDVDAIAASLGAGAHLPDGVHQSGKMQDETRGEMLHILARRGFFSRQPVQNGAR